MRRAVSPLWYVSRVRNAYNGGRPPQASPSEAARAAGCHFYFAGVMTFLLSRAPCRSIPLRVNLGDVIAEGDDIYDDGVNIAARLGHLVLATFNG